MDPDRLARDLREDLAVAAAAEPLAVRIARMGADDHAPLPGPPEGLPDRLGVSGMRAAADAGGGDAVEQGPIPGKSLSEVGVEVDLPRHATALRDPSLAGPGAIVAVPRAFRVVLASCERPPPTRWFTIVTLKLVTTR